MELPELPADLNEVLEFLYGAEPMDGKWWGEGPPEGKAPFWWRSKLRNAMRAYALEAIAAERERCARICDLHDDPERRSDEWLRGYNHAAKRIAAAIRAQGGGAQADSCSSGRAPDEQGSQ